MPSARPAEAGPEPSLGRCAARHAGQVPQGDRRAPGRAARTARHPHGPRSSLASPPPLRRRVLGHPARPGGDRARSGLRRARGRQGRACRRGAGSGSFTRCSATTAACWNACGRARPSSTGPSRSARRCWCRDRSASTTDASLRRGNTSCWRRPTGRPIRWRRARCCPVYPATEGLSHRIIRVADRAAPRCADRALRTTRCPSAAARRPGSPPLADALRAVHRPASTEEAEQGRRRLAFDELLDLQLMLIRARAVAKRQRVGVAFEVKRDLTSRLKQSLPWELTADQQRALREITGDMTAAERMHRLLMGDVGTGKTVVALFAMLLAVENDFQAALMAPTELLAEQHAGTLDRAARAARHPSGAAARAADGSGEDRGPRPARGGAGSNRGGHPCPDAGERLVPAARSGGHRRAASLRRGAAGGADRQRRRAGRPAAHRDADPAVARAHAVRRSRRLDAEGAAPRAGRGADRAPHREPAGEGARLRAAGVRPWPPGVCRPAGDRGIGEGRSAGRHHDGAVAGGPVARAPGRPGARPAQGGGPGRDDAALPRGRLSRCWWPPPSSRSGSTSPTPR